MCACVGVTGLRTRGEDVTSVRESVSIKRADVVGVGGCECASVNARACVCVCVSKRSGS